MEENRMAEAAGAEVARLVTERALRPEAAGDAVRFVRAAWTGQVLTGWKVRGEELTVGERYVWERLFAWMQQRTAARLVPVAVPGEAEQDTAARLVRWKPVLAAVSGAPDVGTEEGRRQRDERTRDFWRTLLEEVFDELVMAFREDVPHQVPRIRRLLFGEEDRAGWNWNELRRAGIEVPRAALAWAYDVLAGATRLDGGEYEDGAEFDMDRRAELDEALSGVRDARRAWYSSPARRAAGRERTRSRSRRVDARKVDEVTVGKLVLDEVPMREISRMLGISPATVSRIYSRLSAENPERYPPIADRKAAPRHDKVHGRERVRPETIQIVQSKRTRSTAPGILDKMRG